MSRLPTPNYVHLYRLASIEGELMASVALTRIIGHADYVVRTRTSVLALRFAGWYYDSRADMSPTCQELALTVQRLALQLSAEAWLWGIEFEQNQRAPAN